MIEIDHVCEDKDCPHIGQRTFPGCKCHKTREQMLEAEVVRLRERLAGDAQAPTDWCEIGSDGWLTLKHQPVPAQRTPDAWQRRIKDRYGKWQDWVECSGDPNDQQRWRNIGCEIRALYAVPSTDGNTP